MIDLLITAHAEGDLAYLPRLFSVLKQVRENAFCIDTGRAWSAESWVCAATENRAPYIVLDAMAYHTVFADGLDAPNRDLLQSQMMTRLVFERGQLITGEHTLPFKRDIHLQAPAFKDGILFLPLPPKGIIQQVTVSGETIKQIKTIEVPSSALPDPTIAATVEFVVGEARYYLKKQGKNS